MLKYDLYELNGQSWTLVLSSELLVYVKHGVNFWFWMEFGLPMDVLHHFVSHFINSLLDCIQFTIWKCHLLQNKPAPWMTAGYLSICCLISCSRTSTKRTGRGNISRKWWNHLILALEHTLGNHLIYHFQGVFHGE